MPINPGLDASGNGNNWATNNINFTTSGVTYDTMTDVPTNTNATTANYCVMNPLSRITGYNAFTYTAGNLNVSSGNVSTFMAGTSSMATPSIGKFYWEATVTTLTTFGDMFIGLYSPDAAYPATYRDAGNISNLSGAGQTSGSTYTAGDIIGVAVDSTNGTVQFYKNNVAQGATPSLTFTAGTQLFAYMASDNNAGEIAASWNFGQRPFTYTPPTGFVALNTFNLPTPTIGATASTQANSYMDVSLYTGNGANPRTPVSNLNFAPDFVWIKDRSSTAFHNISDSVRGVSKIIQSNTTSVEQAAPNGGVSVFNSNGFTVQGSSTVSDVNQNGNAFVAWNWNAGGSTVTNTSGSISSQVRANTSAGFSVVTFSTNASSGGATIGHGLGVAPSMILMKARNQTYSWDVYHVSVGATYRLRLNTSAGREGPSSDYWNSTTPTSSVFSINQGFYGTGVNTVAYCFSEVAGYSKFGSYTGNSSTDGAFVYTGFRPRFVMFKCFTNSGTYWVIIDSARNTSNLSSTQLFPNASDADTTGGSADQPIDILSNGFKLRGTGGAGNESPQSYLYMAFAETPFNYANAR
jgi:hypothetical protein